VCSIISYTALIPLAAVRPRDDRLTGGGFVAGGCLCHAHR
jgi:hypothetical protein